VNLFVLVFGFFDLVNRCASSSADGGADRAGDDQTGRSAGGGALFHIVAAAAEKGETEKGRGRQIGGYGGHSRLCSMFDCHTNALHNAAVPASLIEGGPGVAAAPQFG
jgi:hypothetical protein